MPFIDVPFRRRVRHRSRTPRAARLLNALQQGDLCSLSPRIEDFDADPIAAVAVLVPLLSLQNVSVLACTVRSTIFLAYLFFSKPVQTHQNLLQDPLTLNSNFVGTVRMQPLSSWFLMPAQARSPVTIPFLSFVRQSLIPFVPQLALFLLPDCIYYIVVFVAVYLLTKNLLCPLIPSQALSLNSGL